VKTRRTKGTAGRKKGPDPVAAVLSPVEDTPGQVAEGGGTGIHADLRHYPQSNLRWSGDEGWMPKSQAILLRAAPAKSAIIFVHGWGGSAAGTWESFPQGVGTMSESADVFFLEYPSRTHTVSFCAAQFRKFLFDVARNPIERVVHNSLPADASRRSLGDLYQRIVIVAHSMGAVIVRRALLDIESAAPEGFTDDEFKVFRLLFFAPAHCGSEIARLIGAGLGLEVLPGATLVGSVVKMLMPSLRDLEEGSQALEKLANDNRAIRVERQDRKASCSHLRAYVYHAEKDGVVSQNNFDADFASEPIMGKNHRTICKPAEEYQTPTEALERVFRAFEGFSS